MKRTLKILNILLERKTPITTKDLGNLMNVSDRTIRSDLAELEEAIEKHNVKLVKKSGVGIWIEGSKKNKQQIIFDWDTFSKNDENSYTPKNRQKFILLKLLSGKSRLYIEYFASELYVSKSTIEKDLQIVSEKLSQFNLKLERRNTGGLYITGDEICIRKAMASFMPDDNEENRKKSTFENVENMLDVNIHQIKNSLVDAEDKFKIRFSYLNFNNIAIHIAITVKRVKQGKPIKIPSDLIYDLSNIDNVYKELASYLSDKIEQVMHVDLPVDERYYVLMHILGAHIETQKVLEASNDSKQNSELAEKISSEFISMVSKIAGLDLYNDLTLQDGLKTHLMPAIHRIQYNLNLYNPILQDIKVQYFYAYELSWSINALFEKYLGKSAEEDEIGFITLHLAVAIERQKKKINIAVVCATGIGVSRLMTIRLEEKFPKVNIMNIGLNAPTKQLEEQVDLIISTVPLETEKPYIQVSPLLSTEDVNKIEIMLRKIGQKPVSNLFSFDLTLFAVGGKDKKDYLKEMALGLERYGNVQPKFYDSVIWREELSSTEIGKKVVLTHGLPEYVINSQVCISILEEPLMWDELPAQLIVMIATNKEDVNTRAYNLDWLYKCLDNELIINEIISCSNASEVKQILFREYENLM